MGVLEAHPGLAYSYLCAVEVMDSPAGKRRQGKRKRRQRQVDSDNGYMGDYNYDAYYPSYGGDLGMLEAVPLEQQQKQPQQLWMQQQQHRSRLSLREGDSYARSRGTERGRSPTQGEVTPPTASRSVKFAIDAALHEAMKYKPPITSNKFAALASLGEEEIEQKRARVLQPPVACGPVRVLQSPGAGSPAKCTLSSTNRGERKRGQAPMCKGFRSTCTEECCKAGPDISQQESHSPKCTLSTTKFKDISPIFIANINDPNVAEKIKKIKAQCDVERKEAEAQRHAGDETTNMLKQMMGIHHVGDQHEGKLWRKMSLAIDSGAAETVIPHTLVTEYPIVETEKSRSGACYASATGEPIPNLGEQKLPMATEEGSMRAMTFQAAPVAKPLGSVKRICQAGHYVIFDEDGSYIMNKVTGELNWLREQNGNYMLDVWIPPPSASSGSTWHNQEYPFGRQP